MPILPSRCVLCGRLTQKHCAYCDEPICSRCQVVRKGKVYCTESHRDNDAGIGRLFRYIMRPLQLT